MLLAKRIQTEKSLFYLFHQEMTRSSADRKARLSRAFGLGA
jgi:hypothetical protein